MPTATFSLAMAPMAESFTASAVAPVTATFSLAMAPMAEHVTARTAFRATVSLAMAPMALNFTGFVPVPPGLTPFGSGGGSITSGLWEQARTGQWQPPTGYGAVGPVPPSGASIPPLPGRGYAGPPQAVRATDTGLDWTPPPEPPAPPEPPGEPIGEKLREHLTAAGSGLYEVGRALARDADPIRPCGEIIQIGSTVLICQIRGKHRTHEAGRIRWH